MNKKLENLRVMIVDDNIHMINIVKTLLRGFGLKAFYEATDAAEAFDIVKNEAMDLIIVDYQMDLLDGTDFVRLVRTAEDSPNPFIPIIMLTAHSERSRVISARDAGINEFCCKPVTAKGLYGKLISVINTSRPFVRTATYFGPDRRRHSDDAYKGPFRRKSDEGRETADNNSASDDAGALKTLDFT